MCINMITKIANFLEKCYGPEQGWPLDQKRLFSGEIWSIDSQNVASTPPCNCNGEGTI